MGTWQSRIVGEGEVDPAELNPHPQNWRVHPDLQAEALEEALDKLGWIQRVVVNKRTGRLIDGHLRVELARRRKEARVPVLYVDLDEEEERLALATLDPLSALAETDAEVLQELLEGVDLGEGALLDMLAQYTEEEQQQGAGYGAPSEEQRGALVRDFGAPPFTVLDARAGYWRARKRQWLELGIRGELGREELDSTVASTKIERGAGVGGSIFDPVLTELVYRWFAPPGGRVLDPFAGGSVRGIVAAMLGYRYVGVELREEQVAANRQQAREILGEARECITDPEALTPVEERAGVYLKRDDYFCAAGVRGGKVRTALLLAREGLKEQPGAGLVTAGARQSPQVNIVAHVAAMLGVPARLHVPSGELPDELQRAAAAGAEIVQHSPGYNSVLVARAREDAKARGWVHIPFGMECPQAVEYTSRQVENIPRNAKRLVVPVGSGMTLAGILHGLKRYGLDMPVLGVVVGADPTARLDAYAPDDWRDVVELVEAGGKYTTPATKTEYWGIRLDATYEAKAAPFVEPGDVFWIVGVHQSEDVVVPEWIVGDSREVLPTLQGGFDLVFSCPPYANLEVYSDDPRDLSTMDYPEFVRAYREIIAHAVELLAPDRFAAFVVGEVRGSSGAYLGFVPDTIRAFVDAGAAYYNEATYITPLGSAPIKAAATFPKGRKLVRVHQTLLVHYKGDVRQAGKALGHVQVEADFTGWDNE